MACFCEQAVLAAQKQQTKAKPADTTPRDRPPDAEAEQRVVATSQWLAARWLPEAPWEPDPDWLDEEQELVPPPLPPEAFTVLGALIQAGQTCPEVLDAEDPQPWRALTRLIATLNRRSAALSDLVGDDDSDWSRLATLNAQADTVLATPPQLFDPAEPDPSPPVGPWRPLIKKVRDLAPLIAIGQTLDIDLAEPEATEAIAERVRTLRRVTLPPLEQKLLVHRLISRASALDRLRRSLGIEPDEQTLADVQDMVQQKVERAADALPEALRPGPDGRLEGAPARGPNPTKLVNPAVMAAARKVPPKPLPWKVPAYDQLPLLTSGVPTLTLARLLGPRFVRRRPCQSTCDAAAALRAVSQSNDAA